jgi:hypothetical protein
MRKEIENLWPSLPLSEWQNSYATLHMWTQVIGKIRLGLTPLMNHWWNVPLYVSTVGLTTSVIHFRDIAFQIDLDFIHHKLIIERDDGAMESMELAPIPVSEFYSKIFQLLRRLGIEIKIWPVPVEVQNPIAFDQDHINRFYDSEYSNRFWRILVQVEKIFTEFRSRFIGKCSPVHFFWGSFDLAVTRFSGRRAPERPGADSITREAYSHEVISHGFWPGNRSSGSIERENAEGVVCAPAFYSYTAPAPEGLGIQPIKPKEAFYSKAMGEFILLYEDMRNSDSPEKTLMEFLDCTYQAGANLAQWDRKSLERP